MHYRLHWCAAAVGVALHLAGLGWDAWLHANDPGLAAREGIFTLTNPSHALIIAGTAITAVAIFAMGLRWVTERDGRTRALAPGLRVASLPVLAVLAVSAVWLASRAEDTRSHAHAAVDDHHEEGPASAVAAAPGDDHPHPEAVTESPLSAASAETHAHNEVAVTPEQLLAAADFYSRVKASTAKYEDIRVAMAEGYVQVTQDLPAIAAHFVHLRYNSDGELMNPEKPEILLYSRRVDGNWRFLGVMFTSEKPTETPPSFFGALDVWHQHENLCFRGNGVSVQPDAASCPGGVFQEVTAWNLHVWTLPGATGIFAHDHPGISPGAFPGATRPAAQELLVRAP